MSILISRTLQLSFSGRLAELRKKKGMTQQALADIAGVNVLQIRRYEGGHSQPTLEVIRHLARALCVTSDELIFDEMEREPLGELRLQFEAVQNMDEEEKQAVRVVLDSIILRHTAKRLTKASSK